MEDRAFEPPARWSMTDPRQERVHDRLRRLLGNGPAAFFADACRLVETRPAFAAAAHLVGHCLREVEGALRETLRTAWRVSREQGNTQGKHEREIEELSAALAIPESVKQQWQRLAEKDGDFSPVGWAHRRNLGTRPADASFLEFFEHVVALFDQLLARVEAQALQFYKRLDELTAASPSADAAREVADRLPHIPWLREYFFAKLCSPDWINPLSEAGLLSNPPAPIQSEGGISFPRWPATEYLKRMAQSEGAGDQVLEAVLAVDTDNPCVQTDLIEVVLQLEPAQAAGFVPKASEWLSCSQHLALLTTTAVRLDALLAMLCGAGEGAAALQLARAMWAVAPDPAVPPSETDESRWLWLPRPSVRIDRWHYVQMVPQRVPALVSCCGLAALRMLCALLDNAIRFSGRDEADNPDDGSLTWSPTLGLTGDDHDDARVALTQGIFRAAEQLIKAGSSFAEVASTLGRWPWPVFDRILLGVGRLGSPEVATLLLMDRRRLETWHPEYRELLGARFADIGEKDRESLLAWVERGPDPEKAHAWLTARAQQEPTAEDVETARRRWRWTRLRVLRGVLDGRQTEQLETLDREFGPPGDSESLHRQQHGTAERQPEELARLSDDQLLAYLNSPLGSGALIHADLANAAYAYAARFSSIAAAFRGRHPAYARSLLGGLFTRSAGMQMVAWEPVLDLCLWILRQRPPHANSGSAPEDPWKWEYITIAGVVSRGIADGGIPFKLRMHLWEVINLVIADPEPASDDGGDVAHAADLSLNRTRSRGVHAAIEYAAWVRAHEAQEKAISDQFELAPEVRSVLETHLDPQADPSIAVRAVYGLRFSELARLDPEWARGRVGRIFPAGDTDRRLRDAAWTAHVTHGRLTGEALALLHDHYLVALQEMNDEAGAARTLGVVTDEGERASVEMSRGVAEHLMVAYWRGWSPLSEQDGLIRRFFAAAPAGIRRRALALIGDWLTNSAPVPADVAKRLRELVEWRIEEARRGGAEPIELSAFGTWLPARSLGDDWLFNQLERVLEMFGTVEPRHWVAKALARRAADMPLQAVRCLDLVVQSDREGWIAFGEQDDIKAVIVAASRSSDPAAQRLAADVANRVAARGNPSLGGLLDSD